MYETIEINQTSHGVTTLWLNRAEKHNALSARMISEIHDAAKALTEDIKTRVIVLAARGKSFCAGGDLGWMRDQFRADPKTRAEEATKLARMLYALNTLPKPLIGRIHGNAFGGGVGMVSICDIAVGTENVLMGLTETRLGLIPATIGPYVAARMGEAQARRVFMSGRRFDAQEASNMDLLTKVVPHRELDEAISAEVEPFLSAAPGAVARSKALLRALGPQIDEDVISQTIDALSEAWLDPEAHEGIAAFFEKRKPSWNSGF